MQNSEIKTNPVFDAIKHKWNVFWLFVSWLLVCAMSFLGVIALNYITDRFDWKLFVSFVVLFYGIAHVSVAVYSYYKNVLLKKDCFKNSTAFREAIELVLRVVEGTRNIYEVDVDLLSDKGLVPSEDRLDLYRRMIRAYLLEKISSVLRTNITDKSDPEHESKKAWVDMEKKKIKVFFTASRQLGMFKDVDLGSLYWRAREEIRTRQEYTPTKVQLSSVLENK